MTAKTTGQSPLDNENFAHVPVENITISKDLKGAVAKPGGKGPHPGIVVIMEAYGLNGHIRETLKLLASHGYWAVAPDIYHGHVYDYSDSSNAMGELSRLKDDQVMDEVGQTLDYLGTVSEVKKDAVGITGFCMGGRYVFLTMATHPRRIQAGVSFYGGSIGNTTKDGLGRSGVLSRASAIEHPILLLYGTDDPSIPADEHGRISETMTRLKKEYQLAVFQNAGHAFVNWDRANFSRPAANHAWRTASRFFETYLAR
jgi:carboxymethylenebutenolidase